MPTSALCVKMIDWHLACESECPWRSASHLFLLGGGGSSGPPPNPPPNPDVELDVEDVIFLPPPGSLIANVSPSFKLKSFFGPVGRWGEGASSMSDPSSAVVEGLAAREAKAFCRLPNHQMNEDVSGGVKKV